MKHALRWCRLVVCVVPTAWSCAAESTCSGDWCGTIVVVTPGEPGTLMPPAANTLTEVALADLMFPKLADIGPDLNTMGTDGFQPRLATSWEFSDPTTIRFTLDPSATWRDGVPVTAHDVTFSFDVFRDPAVGAIAGPRLKQIDAVEAPDSHTVVVRFSQSYAEQFFDAVYHVRVLPRHLLDSVPRERLVSHPFGRQPVGVGPYHFVRWAPAQFLELAADSAYFLGKPGIPRVVWRFASDHGSAMTQLLAGEADVLEFLGAAENIQRVERAEHLTVREYPSLFYNYLTFNLRDPQNPGRPHALFADRAVRRAVVMAVDRPAVVRAVLGEHAVVGRGPISTGMDIWSDTLPDIGFDSAAARRELARLGWRDRDGDGVLDRDGRRFAFEIAVPNTSPPRIRSAQIIQDQLRRVGIEVRIAELDIETMVDRAAEGRFDMTFGSYGGDPSPATIAEVWTSDAIGGFNWGRYVNPTVDRLAREAQVARDPDTAVARWHRAVSLINQDAPALFLYVPTMVAGLHRRLEGVALRPDVWASTLWTWRIPPDSYLERDRFGVN